jgi:hypothetical protein
VDHRPSLATTSSRNTHPTTKNNMDLDDNLIQLTPSVLTPSLSSSSVLPNGLQMMSPGSLMFTSPSLEPLSDGVDLLATLSPAPMICTAAAAAAAADDAASGTPVSSLIRPSVTAIATAIYGTAASTATRNRPNFARVSDGDGFAVPLPVLHRRPTFATNHSNTTPSNNNNNNNNNNNTSHNNNTNHNNNDNNTNHNNNNNNNSNSSGELDLPGVKRETSIVVKSGAAKNRQVRKSKRIKAATSKASSHQEVVTATFVADVSTLPVPRSPRVKPEPPSTPMIGVADVNRVNRVSGVKNKNRPAKGVGEPPKKKKKKKAKVAPAMSAVEEKEILKEKKREKKRQKELAKADTKRKRNIERLEKHFTTKLGLKPSNIEAVLAAAPTDPRYQRKVNLIDMSILPTGDTIPLTKPLQYPFDCISFDGKYMLSVLCVLGPERRDAPTICRFVRVPPEDVDVLLGPMGLKDPRESFLSPSLGAAAKRCYLKSTNGWTTWFVLVVHGGRTYRVALDRFRPAKGGPGFVPRPGIQYTDKEIQDMCALAAKSHPSTSEYATKEFFSLVHSMGSHSNREVLPEFLEPLLKVTPTIINPHPTESTQHEQWLLPPITDSFMPTFCHSS